MTEFTLQKDMDFLGFGRMWGCFSTGFINIVEYELGRRLSEAEINQIVGAWFRLGLVLLCNYKNHETARQPGADPKGWDEEANPEWHWWVTSRRATLLTAMEVVGLTELEHEYHTHIIDVTKLGGTTHYTTQVLGGPLMNPNPALTGPLIDTRRIEV